LPRTESHFQVLVFYSTDYGYECNNPWATPPESCDVYEGESLSVSKSDLSLGIFSVSTYIPLTFTSHVKKDQKAGKAINDEPYPNAAGRTDVEGCW
jgi:hypothetical protein